MASIPSLHGRPIHIGNRLLILLRHYLSVVFDTWRWPKNTNEASPEMLPTQTTTIIPQAQPAMTAAARSLSSVSTELRPFHLNDWSIALLQGATKEVYSTFRIEGEGPHFPLYKWTLPDGKIYIEDLDTNCRIVLYFDPGEPELLVFQEQSRK